MTPLASWSITGLGLAIALQVPKPQQTLEGRVPVDRRAVAGVRDGRARVAHRPVLASMPAATTCGCFSASPIASTCRATGSQGGELTFWFQPFYRWIAGALHMIFGDSSMGEFWWDAICVMVSALFAHQVVAARVRISLGPGRRGAVPDDRDAGAGVDIHRHRLVGHRLGRLHLFRGARDRLGAASRRQFRSRPRSAPACWPRLVSTRVSTTCRWRLPSSAFGLSLAVTARGWWRPKTWWPHVSWSALAGVAGVIVIAMTLFTIRTYHYTGVFSMLHGTTWGNHVLWRPGQPIGDAAAGMLSSLMMVLTFNDPPRFALYALPLLVGAFVALAAMAERQGLSRRAAGAGGVLSGGLLGRAGGPRRGVCRPVFGSPARRRLRADGVRDRVARDDLQI